MLWFRMVWLGKERMVLRLQSYLCQDIFGDIHAHGASESVWTPGHRRLLWEMETVPSNVFCGSGASVCLEIKLAGLSQMISRSCAVIAAVYWPSPCCICWEAQCIQKHALIVSAHFGLSLKRQRMIDLLNALQPSQSEISVAFCIASDSCRVNLSFLLVGQRIRNSMRILVHEGTVGCMVRSIYYYWRLDSKFE